MLLRHNLIFLAFVTGPKPAGSKGGVLSCLTLSASARGRTKPTFVIFLFLILNNFCAKTKSVK